MTSSGSIPSAMIQAFLEGPSSPPPDGVVPNLKNPPTRNSEALAIGILCLFLTTTATLARAYSRIFITKKLHVEDYLGLFAFLPFIGLAWCFFNFRQAAGFFVHQWDLKGYVLIDMGYNSFVIGIVYSLVMLLLKTAILLEWVRIFVPGRTRNAFFWTSTVLLGINLAIYTSAIFSDIGGCRPIERLWHFWVAGTCIDRKTRDIVNAAFNLIMDIFILLLPQHIIWTLKMSRRRKIGVSIIFSVGLLVVAIAAGRLYSTVTLDYPDDLTRTFDTTYKFSQTLLWAFSEVTCVFLVFCVPAMPKLFTEQSIVSWISASWRSWKRLSLPSFSRGPRKVSWTRTINTAPRGASAHHLAHYDEAMEGHTANGGDGSLAELAIMRNVYMDQASGGHMYQSSDARIIKTIEFDRRDDAASKTSPYPYTEHQHPWMNS